MEINPLLRTDVYKLSHMTMYAPGTSLVYSYMSTRGCKPRGQNETLFDRVVWFGLQYYLDAYLGVKLEPRMADEFIEAYEKILQSKPSQDIQRKVRALCELGYFPLEIKAAPEGSVLPFKAPLMTIKNTLPDFYWVVGFVESILLKVWYPNVVATHSHAYRQLVASYRNNLSSAGEDWWPDFAVHDFGYRGDSSEEGAAISGAAHLLNFKGSDTIVALPFIERYYPTGTDGKDLMVSVPASEHSVMCSYGRENELAGFENLLDLYPSGVLSVVSDTYNIYRVLDEFAKRLKEKILARDGKLVFRPDSGDPEVVICGDKEADPGTLAWFGAVRLLDRVFGSSLNYRGRRVINPKVGLIYGDAMYLARYARTLARLDDMGYSAENLVIGVGGLLRNHTRDTLGHFLKASYVEVNGEPREISKDPVTDPGKKSVKGLIAVNLSQGGNGEVHLGWKDGATAEEEQDSALKVVFRDGKLAARANFLALRRRVQRAAEMPAGCSWFNGPVRAEETIL